MSGIGGVFLTDGAGVDRELLERMRDIIDYRGPDGSGLWLDGGVGLIHRLLHNSEESVGEKQPLTNGRGLWITADCRIDNREELRSHFLARGISAPPESSDAFYILIAYEIWGEDAPEHLSGDFSFGIWDQRSRSLFSARDPIGIKPFVYYWDGKKFLFGSDIKQIFQDPSVPQTLNLGHLAELLVIKFSNREETPYSAIKRLPPGYSFIIKKGSLFLRKYWNWRPEEELLSSASLEENAEEFRVLFQETVRSRLRTPKGGRVGVLLSGGLDSSSIAAMAASLQPPDSKLSAFTLCFPEADRSYQYRNKDWVDESPYYNALIQKYSLEFHPIEVQGWGPLDNFEKNIWHQDAPLPFPNFSYFEFLYRQAKKLGVGLLLNGEAGDELFWVHPRRAAEDLRKGHVLKFVDELYQRRKYLGASYGSLCRSIFGAFTPDFLKFPFRFMAQPKSIPGWVDKKFSESVHLLERVKKDFLFNPRHSQAASFGINAWLEGGLNALFLESVSRAGAFSQMEIRFPFLNSRLIRWMARIPHDQKQKGVIKKLLLRQSLKGLLPPLIGNRLRKTEFTPAIRTGLEKYAYEELEAVFKNPHPVLHSMIVPKLVQRLHQSYFSKKRSDLKYAFSLRYLWYLVSVDQWLKRKEKNNEFRKVLLLQRPSEKGKLQERVPSSPTH